MKVYKLIESCLGYEINNKKKKQNAIKIFQAKYCYCKYVNKVFQLTLNI